MMLGVSLLYLQRQVKGKSLKVTIVCSRQDPGPTKQGPPDIIAIQVEHACGQALHVSPVWITRHGAAVKVCTKEMAPETRLCAAASSFFTVDLPSLEHDHKGVCSRCAAVMTVRPAYNNCCFNMLASLRYPQTGL